MALASILSGLLVATAVLPSPGSSIIPFDEFARPAAVASAPAKVATRQLAAVPTNYRINDPSQVPGAADYIPAVAANGNAVLVVWRVVGPLPTQRLRAAISEDGGDTYTDLGWLPPLPGNWRWGIDVCVEVDPLNGTFMIGAQAVDPVGQATGIGFVTAQVGSGISWGTPSIIHTTGYIGVFYGDLFHLKYDPNTYQLNMVFADSYVSSSPLLYWYSYNHGSTWSSPDTIATGASLPRVGYAYGPIVTFTKTTGGFWDPLTLESWSYLGPGFEQVRTISTHAVQAGSFPGCPGDQISVPSLAVDRTWWLYQSRAYAAWIESASLTWPTPLAGLQGETEPNDSFGAATLVLASTGHLVGAISPASDSDLLLVPLDERQHLVLTPEFIDSTGVNSNLRIEIFAPDGVHSLGLSSCQKYQIGDARVLFTAPRAGSYFVRFTGFNVASYQVGIAYSTEVTPGPRDRRDVMTSFSTDFGQTWSYPNRVHVNDVGYDAGLVQVAIGNDGRPYLFWVDFSADPGHGGIAMIRTTRSSDGGLTWETPRTLSSATSEWQSVAGSGRKIGYRIGAATTPIYTGELAGPAMAGSPGRGSERAASHAAPRLAAATPAENMHVTWADARDGEGNVYTTHFSTGFEVLFVQNDTTATPGEWVGLRMVLQNRNTVFPEFITPSFLACQRANWGSIFGPFSIDPGTTSSLYPVVVQIPDTAAAGTVFYQAAIRVGAQTYGINTFIRVQPAPTAVGQRVATYFDAPTPNPALSATTFRFSLPSAQTVSLEVFDIAGARVRTLASGFAAAGPQDHSWDLRDHAGRRVAPGVYLARISSESLEQMRRVVVVE